MNTEGLKIENGVLISYIGTDTEVTIPHGVTVIDEGAFTGRDDIVSVVIPDSVTDIREFAFYGCASLEEIVIPYGVKTIGESAFDSCSRLKKVTIPNSVISIGECAFQFTDLKSVVIPDSVTSIGESAFCCTSLESVYIPDSVTSIGEEAFDDCEMLIFIVCSNAVADLLDNEYHKEYTLANFVERFRDGTADDGVTEIWCDLILANPVSVFGVMKNNADFYRFITEKELIYPESVDDVIAITDSAECREMLLEYKDNNGWDDF